MKNRLSCILFVLTLLFGEKAWASCNTPATIATAQAGNWNSASTWVGGVVPSSCDFVIINHNVTLDAGFTIGQNNNGGLTINSGKTLSGSQSLNISSGNTYTLTNNGTLSISSLNLYGGSSAGRFVNNGTATFSSGISTGAYSLIINKGSLTNTGNLTLVGTAIYNYSGATFTVSGNFNIQGSPSSMLDNSGTFSVNGTSSTQAFYVVDGGVYNRETGIINVPNGGFYESSPTTNYIYNWNVLNLKFLELHDAAIFQSSDSVIVSGDLINGAVFTSMRGSYLQIGGNFNQINKSNSFLIMDGYMSISGNFTNDRIVRGGGGISIGGTSYNSSNGTITDSVDICDLTKSNSSLYVDNNVGTIGSNVRKCAYTAPTSGNIPSRIFGNTTVCASSSGNVYFVAAISGATYYKWTVPSGWTITNGQGTRTMTVTSGTSNGNIQVEVTTPSGKGYATTMVFVNGSTPSQPGTIFGPTTTTCSGATGFSYTISPVSGATSYTWTLPTGWSIINGQGTTSISVITGSGSGNVSVTANNQCGSSTARTYAVTSSSTPSAPTSISGNSTVCQNQSFTYSVPAVSGATGYSWTLPSGWTANYPGSGNSCSACSNSITGTIGSSSGTISVTAYNACGSSSAVTLSVTVNGGNPSTPTISGRSNPCAGQNTTYTASSTSASSYTWTVPSGYTLVSGQGTSTIVVTAGAVGNNANIQVYPTNTCGNGSTTTLFLQPVFVPAQPAAISGSANPCTGSSTTYTIASVTGATGYTWTVPSGWTITSGSNTTSITVTPGTTAGTISVTADANNCSSTARTLSVSPVYSSAGNAQTVCATSVTMAANTPSAGTGTWTRVSGSGTITSANSPTNTITSLSGGSSVYRWTVVNGTCSLSSTVTIRKECPALYTVTTAKPISSYVTNENLATVADPDGSINTVTLDSGSLPAGVTLNLSSGRIYVSNLQLLSAGSFPLKITTTDVYEGTTVHRITLTLQPSALPVNLVKFTVQRKGAEVNLQWTTASEINNSHFEVQRSVDGSNFEVIANVQGHGTTLEIQQYSYTDKSAGEQTVYYRLRQVDFNGMWEYSPVRVAKDIRLDKQPELLASPVPGSSENMVIKASKLAKGTAIVQIFNQSGRMEGAIAIQANEAEARTFSIPDICGKPIQPGFYIVALHSGEIISRIKITVTE